MSNKYDVIVIGAGANGLTAAALLAKAGRKTLVVERREIAGGTCAGEEFHPGYRSAGLLNGTGGVRRRVAEELDLASHGLTFQSGHTAILVAQRKEKGGGLLLHRDPALMRSELDEHDLRAYEEYRAFLGRIAPVVRGVFDAPPPDPSPFRPTEVLRAGKLALALRMLGKKDMMDVLRIGPMCVADWLNERFRSELLKSGLCWPALEASFTGPWSPGSNANLVLHECLDEAPVAGGAQALAAALEKAARAQGAEIRTSAPVQRIIVKGGKVSGVRLEDGSEIAAGIVAASCDPKRTFLRLVEGRQISNQLESRIRNFRSRGTTAKINLALRAPIRFACRPDHRVERVLNTQELNQIERAFDAVKYGRFSDWPILDLFVPSESAPSLAPSGHSVVSVLVHFVPYALTGGWTDDKKRELGARVFEVLEHLAPGVSDSVEKAEVLSPLDFEERYGLTEGHVYHGEHALDQLLVRPVPECGRYATPIEGLYVCGGGSYPGGGVTCAPGSLAAEAILAASGSARAKRRRPVREAGGEPGLSGAKSPA